MLALGLAALGGAWLLGMRNKQSKVVRMQRILNRSLLNPGQLATAGTPGSSAAVVRHRGRRSGTTYRTPVGVAETDDGFVIPLVYGPLSDWVQNVLAAGDATITHEGRTYVVDNPRVVAFETVADAFSPHEQRPMRLFNVTECLRVTARPVGTAAAP